MTRRVTGDDDTIRASASRVRSITSAASPMNGTDSMRAGTRSSAVWQSA